jgi:putative solute:sodium symporter small subunit
MNSTPTPETLSRYWRTNLRWITGLLLVWFAVSFVFVFFARDLSFQFLGWPFSFWMASQGSLVIYVAIIWFYAHKMNQLDQEHNVAEDEVI